jgi:3-methyl-2-oxobutanoate hydroxymethyltransferase
MSSHAATPANPPANSPATPVRRLTAPDILARKGAAQPIVALTAATVWMAAMVDEIADVILVGDSLGMVSHGFASTVPVTLEMMALHGQAVMRGSTRALVVVDMPFGTYEASPEVAFASAVALMQRTGCGVVKLEGGQRMASTIRFLAERGVPVMAHIGLTPQAIHTLGSFKARGRTADEAEVILADARAVAEAGAFSVVVEAVAEPLARDITAAVGIPTIGIGASAACDGQILVTEDMLGLFPRVPKFVKRYGELGAAAREAMAAYAADVRARRFPGVEQTYAAKAPVKP